VRPNLAREHRGRLVIAKVDTEAVTDVAARYSIRSIPTLMLFRKGEPVRTLAGAMPALEIERHFGF
jgi:thioredoxin 2